LISFLLIFFNHLVVFFGVMPASDTVNLMRRINAASEWGFIESTMMSNEHE